MATAVSGWSAYKDVGGQNKRRIRAVVSYSITTTETQVKATTRTGRTISRKAINSESIYTSKIKSFISLIRGYGKKKDNAGTSD